MGIDLKKELEELKKIEQDIEENINTINIENIDNIKYIKNKIYERSSKIFIYNLKKLIQLEGTQKKLAKKIGISEDLLSKYKAGDAFPSIETLVYASRVYNIEMDKLVNVPFNSEDVERLEGEKNTEAEFTFERRYYTYFLVTNMDREGAIHEGSLDFYGKSIVFKIMAGSDIVKKFKGNVSLSDKLISFHLHSDEDGDAFISMIRPNVNKMALVGGTGIFMLPSDANSKPCAQKIIFSMVKIDRQKYNRELKELLNFKVLASEFGNVKMSRTEDENVYNFIENVVKKES